MKKLVCIHLLNDYSGSPKVLSQVISASRSAGYDVDLYTGSSGAGFLSGLDVAHYTYFYRLFRNRYLTLFSYAFSQFSLFFKLLKYRNSDVIFYVNTLLPFAAALAGRLTGNTVYYHLHEISQKPAILKRFLRYVVSQTAEKTAFVSQAVGSSEAFPGICERVIYNALPDSFLRTAQRVEYQFRIEGIYSVLMICSLKPYKGVGEFLQIAKLCKSKPDVAFTLVLNASDDEIESYFSDVEVPSNIDFVSKQENMTPFYQRASLLLNLSRVDQWIETFGLTILEAMAFGIPVIVPPVGGPVEIVSSGVEGYLISSYEVDELASLILELANDEGRSLELSANARKRSIDFSQPKFDQEILDFLSE